MARNPYTLPTRAGGDTAPVQTVAVVNSRYAVPSLESGSPFNDEQGWAGGIGTSSTGIPDAERLGIAPIRDRKLHDGSPDDAWYDAYTDFDDARRHTVETQQTEGAVEGHPWLLKRAPDNRWTPVPTTRVTNDFAPSQYQFTRPFARPPARNNGIHFSMADHRRNYPILGMEPTNTRRNTYRIDPTPWDANNVDVPVDASPAYAPGRVQAVDLPPSMNRAHRL